MVSRILSLVLFFYSALSCLSAQKDSVLDGYIDEALSNNLVFRGLDISHEAQNLSLIHI